MRQSFTTFVAIFCTGVSLVRAQGDNFTKNFNLYKNIANNVDFFASSRSDVAPFEKPIQEARRRLETFMGTDLSKGAIVICSSLEQKDALYERRILKMGYRWVITQLTAEANAQQRMAQIKAQAGGQLPPDAMERFQKRSSEMRSVMETRMVSSTVQRAAFAMLSTTLSPEKEFRASRLDDMGRSPLADWLDVGLTSYAAGSEAINYRYLKDHLEEAFPLEDLLSMSRPFVAPNAGGDGGGTQMRAGATGNGGDNGATQGPRQPGGGENHVGGARGGAPMAKDAQDRATFDAQAAAFFAFVLQKIGVEKSREVVQWNREGKLTREALIRPGYLGTDLDQVELDWQSWVKEQKSDGPPGTRTNAGPRGPGDSPD